MEEYQSTGLGDLPEYREVIRTYTRHWPWFLLAICLCFLLAYTYLRYATPKYEGRAKIQIVEEDGAGTELSLFQDMDLLSGENKVEDEIEIINSRSNFIEVVNKLRTNISVVLIGNIKNSELYDKSPIAVSFISSDSVISDKRSEFYIELSSDDSYTFKESIDESGTQVSFGKNVKTPLGEAVIVPNVENFKRYKGATLLIKIRPVAEVAEEYRSKAIISPIDKASNILNMVYKDPIQQKAIDILSELIRTYNENAVSDRKAIADKTSLFIEERINSIYDNLSNVDETEEDFRTERGLTNVESESNINLSLGADMRRELNNNATQLNIAQSMRDIIEEDEEYDLLPANIGLADPAISNTTAKYNQLVSERNRLLKSSNEKNPIIVNLDQEINGLKSIMKSSLNSSIKNLQLQASGLNRQQSRLNSRISSTPKNQRALRDITRKKETTESLYLYLLQKREESQIAYASSKPKSKIIDKPYGPSEFPISPKPLIVYLGAFLMALVFSFSVIFLQSMLDNKVKNRASLEKIIGDFPVLGELPKTRNKERRSIQKNDRSVLAESMRIISSNLDYILKKGTSNDKNVIFVTSSIPGEGKTFFSSNLAMILADSQNKVLLIGADIRNPQINNFFFEHSNDNVKSKKRIGLTDYLHNEELSVSDVITTMDVNEGNISIIYSGKVPPNPGELIKSKRIELMMKEVSGMYDYVIVDTAPIVVVSDTLRLSKYAEHTIYVTKAGVTELKLLEYPIKLQKEGQLKNISFIVNAVKGSHLGYYGKYGYGYGESRKKWWKV
ncbi:tyrosine-protein kinase [uncultured Zobellia sp.]|uniref:GumC family protein n=1 Tax=uncultured Zobellia sp. TaxID=255433 RepID=UPI0025974B47|nr:tyrosine-protein kinase [uncultured Zobellia sp.]